MYRFKPQWRGKLSRHDCKNCWLLCKELAQTNSNLTNYSCYCLILFVWFDSLRPSVLRKDQHVSCSRTQPELGPTTPRSQVKHSTTEPLRPPLLMFMNPVMPDKIVYTGLLVISFAAFFLQQIMLTLPRAVAHLSCVIRLPSMWNFHRNRMQQAYAATL